MGRTKFIYGSFCWSSQLGPDFVDKGCGAYVGWTNDVDDWIAEEFSFAFYQAALVNEMPTGLAWKDAQNKYEGRKYTPLFHLDGSLVLKL